MNSKTIGENSEAQVLAAFTAKGYPVLLPFGDNQPYDLVVEVKKKFLRVQVKTGREIDGSILYPCVNGTDFSKYTREIVDLFAVYCASTHSVYIIPVEEARGKLRVSPPKNNQRSKICWTDDYHIDVWSLGEMVITPLCLSGSTGSIPVEIARECNSY